MAAPFHDQFDPAEEPVPDARMAARPAHGGVRSLAFAFVMSWPARLIINFRHARILAMRQRGRAEEALDPATRSLRLSERVFGRYRPETAVALNDLAGVYRDLGYLTRAEALYQQAIEVLEATLGPDHLNTAITRSNLAGTLAAMGASDRAARVYERALPVFERSLGLDDPSTAVIHDRLAGIALATDQPESAARHLEALVAHARRTTSPRDGDTARALFRLALARRAEGDEVEAQRVFGTAAKAAVLAEGPESELRREILAVMETVPNPAISITRKVAGG